MHELKLKNIWILLVGIFLTFSSSFGAAQLSKSCSYENQNEESLQFSYTNSTTSFQFANLEIEPIEFISERYKEYDEDERHKRAKKTILSKSKRGFIASDSESNAQSRRFSSSKKLQSYYYSHNRQTIARHLFLRVLQV